jgi:2-polyprenyl-3-methyl-5-hydroxy-6-metoxy-1,4-benzoquinol methylase
MPAERSIAVSPAERHRQEAEFFDQAALRTRASLAPLHEQVLDRYRRISPAEARFPLEYAIALVRCHEAPRVLDVGCGDGANAVLMAALGAHVTGFDVSPESIATASEWAHLNGVGDRTRFMVGTAEAFQADGPPFDVVWCDAVLHHVIPELPHVLECLRRHQRPRGRTVFVEPISVSPALRTLRAVVPLATEATPGERPLQRAELQMIRNSYPNLASRHFRTFGRLDRILLRNTILELASPPRRTTIRLLAAADHAINRTALARFASIAVMHSQS